MKRSIRLEPVEPFAGVHVCPFCRGHVRVVSAERMIEHHAPACVPFDQAMGDRETEIVLVLPVARRFLE